MTQKTTLCQDHKDKISQARKGQRHSEETKAKMRESQQRRRALKAKTTNAKTMTMIMPIWIN